MTRPDYCPVAQEPCQAMCSMSDVRCKIRDTHPQPKREWVGLTERDKQIAFDDTQEGGGFWEFADAIEAKLKEKNGL
jgi:hypothetical protein